MTPPALAEDILCNVAWNTQSLGRNCEYGFIQRQCKAEPISLLRWSGMPTTGLIDALACDFAGLMDSATGAGVPLRVPYEERKWWLTCGRFELVAHTADNVVQFTVEQAAERIRGRLRLLARKLMEDIRGGEKIFVYSSADFTRAADARPLIAAVRDCGGHGRLIIVGGGADEKLRQIDDAVWWARLPRLTRMMAATGADVPAWMGLLADIAVAIPEAAVAPYDGGAARL